MAYSDLDDVDYLVEDNVMDEFAYHRKWKRPMVEWHIGGASQEQNANARNDSGNWGRTQQQRVNSLLEWLQHNRGNLGQSQLVPMITRSACACSQELEHFHIHQSLPTSVPRILVTQHTTMMNSDGGCRCKGRQHFLRFHLSCAKGTKSG